MHHSFSLLALQKPITAPEHEDNNRNHNAETCSSETTELKWRLVETWSASGRASLIKPLIRGDHFNAYIKAKSKHFEQNYCKNKTMQFFASKHFKEICTDTFAVVVRGIKRTSCAD